MFHRIKSFPWFSLGLLLLAGYVLKSTWLSGDGGEYLIMAHAIFSHGSAVIRPSDVADYLQLPLPELARIGFPREALEAMQQHFQTDQIHAIFGFFPNAAKQFYACHFWFYSLLAVPFYALVKMLGLNLIWALTLLNLSFAGTVFWYLRRVMPQHARMAFLLFLTMGTTFYLTWSGAEVMSASCALIAAIAILRGEIGLAMLFSGLGATQNPSMIFMMPFAIGYRVLLHKRPQLAWPGSRIAAVGKRDVWMALVGIALSLSSYTFFLLAFGTPSLTAKYATDVNLISWNRFFSLFFDLDQGVWVGLPGLFLALAVSVFLIDKRARLRWSVPALTAVVLAVAMAVPVLSTINWNSGYVVFLRYAYWSSMPLVALLLLSLRYMPENRARWLTGLVLAIQLGMLAHYGLLGEKGKNNLEHEPQTRWVLKHFPASYNPDPEIFYERSIGHEWGMPLELSYVYQHNGVLLKLLRQASNTTGSAGLCAADEVLQGSDVRTADRGWQYLHAPFVCRAAAGAADAGAWQIVRAYIDDHTLLTSGWSGQEQIGTWTDGLRSSLTVPIPAGQQALRLRLRGAYYGDQHQTIVTVNGQILGDYNLAKDAIDLPANLPAATVVTIGLQHPGAVSPKMLGASEDPRLLGYYLQGVVVERRQ